MSLSQDLRRWPPCFLPKSESSNSGLRVGRTPLDAGAGDDGSCIEPS
jgi:hypothetical protein